MSSSDAEKNRLREQTLEKSRRTRSTRNFSYNSDHSHTAVLQMRLSLHAPSGMQLLNRPSVVVTSRRVALTSSDFHSVKILHHRRSGDLSCDLPLGYVHTSCGNALFFKIHDEIWILLLIYRGFAVTRSVDRRSEPLKIVKRRNGSDAAFVSKWGHAWTDRYV